MKTLASIVNLVGIAAVGMTMFFAAIDPDVFVKMSIEEKQVKLLGDVRGLLYGIAMILFGIFLALKEKKGE